MWNRAVTEPLRSELQVNILLAIFNVPVTHPPYIDSSEMSIVGPPPRHWGAFFFLQKKTPELLPGLKTMLFSLTDFIIVESPDVTLASESPRSNEGIASYPLLEF